MNVKDRGKPRGLNLKFILVTNPAQLTLLYNTFMKYYLAKTDPLTYSINDLERDNQTEWDGVHNPTAVIFLRQMRAGDRVLIYHSQGEASIAGLAEVVGVGHDDPNDHRTYLQEFKFIRKFDQPYVTLKEVKESGKFPDFRLVRQGRLSTMDVPEEFIIWLKKKGLKI